MWIQAKWGTLKDELWKQCMALTRMDCWTFSQQEKQMYLMFIFNSSDNWACCVQENMAAIVWTAFCEIVLFTPVKQLQKMRPILQHLLPYHCTLKKKKKSTTAKSLLWRDVRTASHCRWQSEQSLEKDKEHCLEKKTKQNKTTTVSLQNHKITQLGKDP